MNELLKNEEIVKALKLFFQPNDVFEIRILDAVTRAYFKPHVESGYFHYDNIEDVPAALSHIKSAKGFYVTVNPVKPELLNRAVNRVRPSGREPTTADGDIICRRWLLIDCDAKRASGIPSSDSEHELAYKKAVEIRDGFASINWPMPIMLDSGNGAQLMYRIDLPAADGDLVHEVLKNVSAVSSDSVDIDVTVHNSARIWRLPGTMNVKGDSTSDRPHRMAHILTVPDKMEIVTETQLRAACAPVARTVSASDEVDSDFDLDSWIQKYCHDITGPESWKDGRKWVFDVCPFNSDHTNRSAVITQQSNGAIGFTCHHNGCKNHDWKELRSMLEPIKPIEEYPEVDLTGFFENIKRKKARQENPFADPGSIPQNLLSVPGMVNDIVSADLATAPYPNRILAFAGALSFVAHLAGRKMRDRRNNYTNIYLIALANSGTGKDHPRKVNIDLASMAGIAHTIRDSFASGAGLEDAMFMTPAQLFQMDEVDWLFNTLKGAKDASVSESINEKLLKFYSSSNSIYSMRVKARLSGDKDDTPVASQISNPCLNLFGTAVPDYFYDSLSRRVLENGLVARCMILEADKRGKHGTPGVISKSVKQELMDRINHLAQMSMNEDMLGHITPYEIPETVEATNLLDSFCTECDNRYDGYEKLHELSAMALWARAMEKVYKLSMVYSISENPYKPYITAASVTWAWNFVSHVTRMMLFRAGQCCYESKSDQLQKRFMKKLHDAGGEMSHSDIMYKLHLSKSEMKEIVGTLTESEQIVQDVKKENGKSHIVYREII